MLRPRRIRVALASLLLSAVLPAFALAQERRLEKASLQGTVRDSRGQPVAGATVRLESLVLGVKPVVTVSDSSGHFSFADLDTLKYDEVWAAANKFKRARVSCSLEPGRANEITITLAPEESATPSKDKGALQFHDEPRFTVSGVTDTTNLGGHGSDTAVRTRDSLAKETVSLGKGTEARAETASLPTRETLTAERDRAQALVTKNPGKAEPHHRLADADERLGDSLSAVGEYRRAAEIDPRETYLFDWGSELLLHHAPEPALQVFAKGNRLFPQSERLLLGMGAAWFALGSLDAAFDTFRAASDLAPNDVNPYLFVGKMEEAERIPSPAAVEMLHRFLARSPENAEANYYYASTLWRSRENSHDATLKAEVETLLRKATQLDSRFVAAYIEIGVVHADQHEYDKAINEYEQALQIASDLNKAAPGSQLDALAEAHFRLGSAYRESGDRPNSARQFKTFEQLSRQSQRQAERERHDIQQFVYTLRDQPPAQVR